MVVVVGREGRILSRVLAAFAEEGVRAHGGLTQDPSDLFGLVTELECTAVVGIGPLAWWGSPDAGSADLELLEPCLRAAQSPVRPRLVWVTAEDAGEEEAKRIRRSGVPYVIVRAAPLVGETGSLAGQEVLVPKDLPAPARGVATPEELAEVVVRAALTDEVGRTLEVAHRGERAWCEVVESLGGRARTVGAFRAGAARLLGQPVLELHRNGLRVRGSKRRPDVEAASAPAPGTYQEETG